MKASQRKAQAWAKRKKMDRERLAMLIKKNAEDLMMTLCGKGYDRAFNPDRPPARRRAARQ